jgi:8-oxo-dGTP pyrophosphatase MutT (NUDIX family)
MINCDSVSTTKLKQLAASEQLIWSALPAMKASGMRKKQNQDSLFPDGSASVIIVEQDSLILAVSRKDNHGDLGLPGGKIEAGETPLTAACREAVEETGATLCNPFLVGVADVGAIKVFIYRAEIFGDVHDHVNVEGALVKWVKPEEICSGSFGQFNTEFILPALAR